MNKVFVVNEPLTFSNGVYGANKTLDLSPAKRFGKLVYCVPAGNPPDDPSLWHPQLRQALKNFHADDYLLPVGHPALLVASGALLYAQGLQKINLLKWRRNRGYEVICLPVCFTEESPYNPSRG